MRKRLMIGVGIVLLLIAAPFVILKLAFGPLHDSITIDLGTEGELICDETYNGDFAGEFYDVAMSLETTNGAKWDFGSAIFQDQDWSRQVKPIRVGEWLVIALEPEHFVQLKMLNTSNGKLNDTTLLPFNLGKDSLYRERYKDMPNHLYPGTSKIVYISGDMIEVDYEYEADAAYPYEIVVNQRVVYEISRTVGKLQTREVHDRVVQ